MVNLLTVLVRYGGVIEVKKMRNLLKTILISLSLFYGCAYADSNKLMDQCVEAENFMDRKSVGRSNSLEIGYCFGFLQGVRNMLQIFDKEMKVCWPKNGIENGQAVRIVLKYMRENPNKLHEDQLLTVILAFREAYPCR